MKNKRYLISELNDKEILKCIYLAGTPVCLYDIEEKGFNKIDLSKALERSKRLGLLDEDVDKRVFWLSNKGRDLIEENMNQEVFC
ncbi:hypothetical protein [Orenia marismortui]|uniref:MarR family transcriptional regulator n=1 Tax=Orenia marismortui TaxID=46469 RepID=A0A4R8H187_9FIRM|nr:hypothetical protein [Orenia marismortui]TDX53194.1 hypothetical protein C7959_10346 [Orenia marismortui]